MYGKYKKTYINGKCMPEHRHIMEKHIGRKLLKTEIVHHKDGNTGNNDISNLEILTSHSDHVIRHAKLRRAKYPLKPDVKDTKLYVEYRKAKSELYVEPDKIN